MHDKLREGNTYSVFVEHIFQLFVHFALDGEDVALVTRCGKLQGHARRAEFGNAVIAYISRYSVNLYTGKILLYYFVNVRERLAVFYVDKRFRS